MFEKSGLRSERRSRRAIETNGASVRSCIGQDDSPDRSVRPARCPCHGETLDGSARIPQQLSAPTEGPANVFFAKACRRMSALPGGWITRPESPAELPNSETDSGPLGTKCAVEASMDGTNTLSRLTDQRVLDPIAEPLTRAIRRASHLPA